MAVAYEQRPEMLQTSERLEQLFWTHHERVLRAAYRVTGNMADAEDVAQAVFMRLVSDSSRQMDNPESYLYRAAINGAVDLLRKRRSEREVGLELVAELPSGKLGDAPDHALSDQQLRFRLRQALSILNPRSAEMFVLRYIEELDNREIARLLGTSQAVVAVTLHHARSRLKKQFRSFLRGER